MTNTIMFVTGLSVGLLVSVVTFCFFYNLGDPDDYKDDEDSLI